MTSENTSIATIKVDPSHELAIQNLHTEALKLKEYAVARVILVDADLKPATEDLSIIAGLRKAIEEKKKEYVSPIKAHLDAVNEAFKQFTAPLVEADMLNRDKVKAYRAEQERKRTEAEAIEREKLELSRREMALTGETTVDLTPIPVPEVVNRISTGLGTLGMMRVRKYRVVNFANLPDQYKIENSVLLNKVTKAGIPEIAGIEFYYDEVLRVNPH